jgi:hypothetical protein
VFASLPEQRWAFLLSHGNLLAYPTGTSLPSLSHGNLLAYPQEPVYLAYPMGTC